MGGMIHVLVRHSDDSIRATVEGHAGYEVDGKDVVCAGVSALAQGVHDYLKYLKYVRHSDIRAGYLDMALVRVAVTLHMVRMLVGACESIKKGYQGTITIEEVDEFGN